MVFKEELELEDVTKEKIKQEIISRDQSLPRLLPITKDQFWRQTLFGSPQTSQDDYQLKQVCDLCLLLQNLNYPGYSLFYSNKRFFSVYIGDGYKCSRAIYYPEPCYLPIEDAQTKVLSD